VRPHRQLSNADQPHPKQTRGCRFRPSVALAHSRSSPLAGESGRDPVWL